MLGYLSTTMTAEEIAAQLHVSVNTVRTHQRAIYRKLGVGTRRDAIRLGRAGPTTVRYPKWAPPVTGSGEGSESASVNGLAAPRNLVT